MITFIDRELADMLPMCTTESHVKTKSGYLNHDLVFMEPLSALVILSPGHMPPSVAVCEGIIQFIACKYYQ